MGLEKIYNSANLMFKPISRKGTLLLETLYYYGGQVSWSHNNNLFRHKGTVENSVCLSACWNSCWRGVNKIYGGVREGEKRKFYKVIITLMIIIESTKGSFSHIIVSQPFEVSGWKFLQGKITDQPSTIFHFLLRLWIICFDFVYLINTKLGAF